MDNIKAITIDFWDTIFVYPSYCPFSENILNKRVDFTHNLLKDMNISREACDTALRGVFGYFEKIWVNESRTPTTPEMMKYMLEELDIEVEADIFDKLVDHYENMILKEDVVIIDRSSEVLKELSEKYKLVIISDTGFEPGDTCRKIMEKYGIKNYFTGEVFSNEVGFSKPDIKMFEHAAKIVGCEVSEMIHIGDRENKDIDGAISASMKSIMFGGTRDNDYESSKATYKAKTWDEIKSILLD